MEDKFPNAFERKRASYVLLMQTAIWKVSHRVTLRRNETLACMFEEDKFVEEALTQQFLNIKNDAFLSPILGTLTIGEKIKYPALQAADLLAYEGMKQALNQIVDKGIRPIRKSYACLKSTGRLGEGYMDEVTFMKVLSHIKDNDLSGISL